MRRHFSPAHPSRSNSPPAPTSSPSPAALSSTLDVIFPILHGTFGEDGTIQGLLELADIAYVGSGVLGSAAGMDKIAMKQLFAAAGLPQTPYVALTRTQWHADPKRCTKQIEKSLQYPVFVKPANLGSSVGISKVRTRAELNDAMDLAASFDRRLIVEQGVGGSGAKPRELEVAVLGNETPEASVVGEIVPDREFYDYASKYDATSTSEPVIPPVSPGPRRSRSARWPSPPSRPATAPASPRRLPDGTHSQRQEAAHLPQRDQYDAWLHQHQHVPQALGSHRHPLQTTHRPAYPARPRTPQRKAADQLYPRLTLPMLILCV